MRTRLIVLVFAFWFIVLSSPPVRAAFQDVTEPDARNGEQAATSGSYEYQDRVVVQTTVEDVMARQEFLRLRSKDADNSKTLPWLERLFDWLESLFAGERDGDPNAPEGGVGAALLYGVALVIVLGALAFIVKSILDSAKESELAGKQGDARIAQSGAAPGETSPEEYWARAQQLAAAGNEKLALRELLLGAMSALERRGAIRHRRGLTNRDYLWAASGDARESVRTIIAAFEQVYFGRRAATADGFRECSRAYRVSFYSGHGPDADEASVGGPA